MHKWEHLFYYRIFVVCNHRIFNPSTSIKSAQIRVYCSICNSLWLVKIAPICSFLGSLAASLISQRLQNAR